MSAPSDSGHPGRWSRLLPDGRIQCDLCPRRCRLNEGQRAFCFVRKREGERIVLTTYGRSTGFCVDPIEKKPLNHFLPGTAVLSFGTAGCNLGCRFCQNWESSKARETEILSASALPERIAEAALESGSASVAFTYNDPVIWAEYALDTAAACRERGVRTVAVTAGYITPEARGEFFSGMDAANVDLKAFTDGFYRKLCLGERQPVLDTLIHLRETEVWVEVTTLLIPGHNDGPDEIDELSRWLLDHLGPEVPLHFTAFHPDFRMRDLPPTPRTTLRRARRQALDVGLKHVYTGNVSDVEGSSTYCAGCGALLLERDGYGLGRCGLDERGRCAACGRALAGRFDGRPGNWGGGRRPLRV